MRKRLNVMKILMKNLVISRLALSFNFCFQYKSAIADNGYRLWLRYEVVKDQSRLKDYQSAIQEVVVEGNTPILKAVIHELKIGLAGLLSKQIAISPKRYAESMEYTSKKHR